MKAKIPDHDLLSDLIEQDHGDLVSIIIPTHERGREIEQDGIRFKNAISSVDDELADLGWKPRERSERLSAASQLIDDREFWEHQSQALAVYIAPDGEVTPVSLSMEFDQFSAVMPVFAVRHIVSDLNRPAVATLALTRDFVALYRVDRRGVQRVEADLPKSFDDVNWFVDRERQRQQHPGKVGSTSNKHGHETGDSEDLNRFLRAVSDALPKPGSLGLPLVVLGDDDLVNRFSDTTDHDTVSRENTGLASPVSESDIAEMALEILDEIEEQEDEKMRMVAREQLGLDNATVDLPEALRYAISGRIKTLIMAHHAPTLWGRVDTSTLEVSVHQEREPGDVDLTDRVVVLAMETGAEINPVAAGIDGEPLVAVSRF